MYNLTPLEPVDYLVIGHVTHDLTPSGSRLGGTAAYSALTAQALGMRVGVFTASGTEADLSALQDILNNFLHIILHSYRVVDHSDLSR